MNHENYDDHVGQMFFETIKSSADPEYKQLSSYTTTTT